MDRSQNCTSAQKFTKIKLHGDKISRGHKTARRVILHEDTFAIGDKTARADNFARWFMHKKINKK